MIRKKLAVAVEKLQVQYLNERLEVAFSRWIGQGEKDAPEPAKIVAMRRTIKEFEKTRYEDQRAREKLFRKQAEREANAVREAILFRDPKDALMVLREFERKAASIK